MSARPFSSGLAVLLTVAIIAPSIFLVAPQKVYALVPGVPTIGVGPVEIKTSVESTISAIKNSLSWALDITNTAANYAQQINTYVLQPLAFVLSGNLMKALTASVIAFVIGKANGTGAPQFATDVMGSLQTVSDSQALAYLNQFATNSNSPFAYSISSALRVNYLQKTSLAGFWSANMSTLSRYSPNQNAFLAGNWSQGGVAAWFALTTQSQNNPYMLYQNSQDTLSTLIGPGIGGATGARVAQLGWGQGFMSWCGTSDAATQAQETGTANFQSCLASGASESDCQSQLPTTGINPGDACTNKDGTSGTIKTPGSVIKATLDKVLGGQQDQIVRLGNVGPQINQILGNIGTVLQTVQFASQLLGGSNSGGLFGIGQTSSSNSTSRLTQFAPTRDPSTGAFTSDYLNTSTASINESGDSIAAAAEANAAAGAAEAAAAATAADDDILSRITQYETAWNTIKVSANTASSSVLSLANLCTSAANTAALAVINATDEFGNKTWFGSTDVNNIHTVFIDAARTQAATAKTTLSATGQVASVLTRAVAAAAIIVSAKASVEQVQEETQSSGQIQALQSIPPTTTDVISAQQNAKSFGGSKASPGGSLNVSGGTLVDQMNLMSTNASTLKTTVCNPSSSLYVTESVGG